MYIVQVWIPVQNVLVFMTAGEDVGVGQFLLNGREDAVATLGPQYVFIRVPLTTVAAAAAAAAGRK